MLYGASGFVAPHTDATQVRWAIASRNRQKLEAVREAVGVKADVMVADSQDQAAIVVGTQKAIAIAVRQVKDQQRYTLLDQRLQETR